MNPILVRKKEMLRFFDDTGAAEAATLLLGVEKDLEEIKEGVAVTVSGLSKGKGFQGVVKRHGFHGGP